MSDILTRTSARQIINLARDIERTGSDVDNDYNLNRGLHGLAVHQFQQLAPHEHRCSERIAEAVGRAPRPGHMFVPIDRRDLTVASGPSAGFLVQTDAGPGNLFLSFLYAALGPLLQWISRLSMQGNASIPAASGSVTAGWLSTESTQLTESQFAFVVEASTPKTVGAYTEGSRHFMLSTSAFAQAYIMWQLARAVAAEMFAKFFSGTGASGQITGLINVVGVGAVSGTSLATAGILDAIKIIEDASALIDPSKLAFVVAPDAARLLRLRELAAGSGMLMVANTLAGYSSIVTKTLPDSTIVLGDYSQAVLLEWGILEVGVDPYGVNSALFSRGLTGLRAIWTCDVVCLQPKSFVKVTSIT